MYGSDRVLLDIVTGLDRTRFQPIVVLPWEGPLQVHLQREGVETHVGRLARLSRNTLSVGGMARLPLELLASARDLSNLVKNREIALVHSNTLAVVSGALWAKMHGIFHLWHVHEMIVEPRWVSSFYRFMLNRMSDMVVFNSRASMNLFSVNDKQLCLKSEVVWNGIRKPDKSYTGESFRIRKSLGLNAGDVLVLLVGRINRWKGQKLLVDAAGHLWDEGVRNIHFLVIGDTFQGREYFREELVDKIHASPAVSQIHLLEFQEDIWPFWHACDIAVVPSTEPEPFGLVAIEAMAASKPVIAASHGGLLEIVEHEKTGLLVSPGDVNAFADAIAKLAADECLREMLGKAGAVRYERYFSREAMIGHFEEIYSRIIAGSQGNA
jgi:glycosyltransferase involved in cell wall biosynthesis